MKKKTKTLLTCLAVPLGVGAVSGFLTQGSMNTFEKLKQPPLTPPGWVFPVVWTGLFAMMGTASYLVAITPKTEEPASSSETSVVSPDAAFSFAI